MFFFNAFEVEGLSSEYRELVILLIEIVGVYARYSIKEGGSNTH